MITNDFEMKELKIHLRNHTGENPVINFGKVRYYNTSNQLNISNSNFVSKTYIVQTVINHCIEKISLKLCVVSQRGDNNMVKSMSYMFRDQIILQISEKTLLECLEK